MRSLVFQLCPRRSSQDDWIDNVYISKEALCCTENGNIDGDIDNKLNLADITRLIDHVYISKAETAACE